jgi:4-amino-4-deoxy-L-arabinose transferase-like glycosyltransferase
VVARALLIVAIVFLLRLPFLSQAIQGDDPYYLYGAEHAQIDPLHPHHARYIFQGDLVDMRGFPHPPLNAWILAALLAVFGSVSEVPFHFAYILWSVIAALAMWSLARRFCDKPFMATLLFLAVPAFVVNGNSLESDVPFLAFWMCAIALFVGAVDEHSRSKLAWAAAASVLAALAAYQAIFLTPVLAVYLFERRRKWTAAWLVVLVAPLALGIWQIFERSSTAELPAAVLTGYLQTLEVIANKVRNAGALVVHFGWIVSPLLVLTTFFRGAKWRWIAALVVAAAGAFYDPNPLFWASLGCGVLVLTSCLGRGFLGTWVLLFFAGALVVFFAGSARYLLPIAAPVAILVARSSNTRLLALGFVIQMMLSIGLAIVNYQHWDAYRKFAASFSKEIAQKRTWINAEWGLRFYLEAEGALPMPKGQLLQPGEILVSSALALPLTVNASLAPISQLEIRPAIPLRIVSLDGRSAYSSASLHGLLPFEISTAPIDRVRAEIVLDRKPELTFLDPRDPRSKAQVVGGLFEDGWMSDEATVLLKRPEQPAPLRAVIYIPPNAPARHVRMLIDGQLIADETFGGPGGYTMAALVGVGAPAVTVTLSVDKTFSAPGDQRKLGVVVTGVGFR